MNHYLLEQLKNHPSMEPQDIVKLCYQAAYGAEHLLTDIDKARQYLFAEFDGVEPADIPVYEPISDLYCRVNIAGWKYHGLSKEELFDIFQISSGSGHKRGFSRADGQYLETVKHALGSEQLLELRNYLEQYYRQGVRPVHHSEKYRRAEKPHYRVVRRELLPARVLLR